MRLIDADAVIRVLKGFRPMIPYDKELRKALGDKVEGYLEAERIIRSAPTIDAEGVVHGEWVEKEVLEDTVINEWQSAKCSKCGKYHTTPYMYYFDNFNYCPNCGARMKGADNE